MQTRLNLQILRLLLSPQITLMMPTKRVSMMKLALRKGDALALAQPRAKAVNSENIRKYYCLLEETLNKHGLFNSASRIYNMDESGMPLDHKPKKVVA